uniref:Actinodin1 n=1 Tax=Denticeps clupeoides TaxID=299321 RepID=A0AAY4F068_9TELE
IWFRPPSPSAPLFFPVLLPLPELLVAGPVPPQIKGDGKTAVSSATSQRLIRNRRNISWYKQHSDFWNWYKYFTDTGNQEGVSQLDRVYLAYLQNKNRAEGQRSYKMYLQHLGDIYKSCAESSDPNCVASYMARPKEKSEPPKPAQVKACDPYRDPYCLYSLGYTAYPYTVPSAAKAPAPAAVKSPAYLHTAPVKDPQSGYYYYAPVMQSFLSAEQRSELLRICDPKDVECLQYHLRAAYGYRPATGPLPSYAHLSCDPKTDRYCQPQIVQKAPSGVYASYPYCNPYTDPYCAYVAALHADQNSDAQSAPVKMPCNPLFDDNCNPLTAARMASPPQNLKDEPAPAASDARAAPAEPRSDPYAMYREAAAAALHRRPPPQPLQPPTHRYQPDHMPERQEEAQHPLGPRGKTKEGYDCFIGYDEECFPLRAAQHEPRSGQHRQIPFHPESYEPHLNPDGTRSGVIEPDPDCDPEYDRNCRLRRYEPEPAVPHEEAQEAHQAERHHDQSNHEEEPHPEHQPGSPSYSQDNYDPYQSGQEDPFASYGSQDHGAPSFPDVLRGFGGQYGQDDHRAYTGDYKKK